MNSEKSFDAEYLAKVFGAKKIDSNTYKKIKNI